MTSLIQQIVDQLVLLNKPGLLDWVAAVGSSLTFFVICFYIFQYIKNNRRHKYEKAIEFANLYAKEVLPYVGYILMLYESANVEDIMHKVRNAELKDFDYEEYMKILSDSEQQRLKEAFNNISIDKYIQAHEKYFYTPYPDCITSFDINNLPGYIAPPNDKEQMLFRIFTAEYNGIVSRLLNTLETIAMGYVLKVADERVVYCSLHQSYFDAIRILFLKIAPLNDKAEDRYFSYIAKLYQLWDGRHNSQRTEKAKFSVRLGFPGKPLTG